MRAYLPQFEAKTPKNLKEALKMISAGKPGDWKPFAGGTDIMVFMAAGKIPSAKYVNIWGLKELKKIKVSAKEVEIGALVTFTELREHPVIRKEFPNIVTAASETGAIAIQNRGTIGGNIANASPAADTPPALLSYDAVIELVSLKGKRKVSYADFHTGYKTMVMQPNELISSVRLPRTKGKHIHFYRKVGTRKAQAISKTCFSAFATFNPKKKSFENVRIGLGSVAPQPIRCPKTEALLCSSVLTPDLIRQAKETLRNEIAPINDIRSTSDYRNIVTQNVLEQFIRIATGGK